MNAQISPRLASPACNTCSRNCVFIQTRMRFFLVLNLPFGIVIKAHGLVFLLSNIRDLSLICPADDVITILNDANLNFLD